MNSDISTSSPETVHISVLLNEAVEALAPKAGGRYLDGTVGMGGHSFAIMERTGGQGFLCGLDRDTQALELARVRLAPFGDHVHLAHTRYSAFEATLDELGWDVIDGALIDIGVSSLQIDSAERGFSFSSDGPLDMRMDRDSGDTPVSRLVNRAKQEELKDIIERYGEDPQAGRIAKAIVEARIRKPIETTGELAALVERAYPAAWRAKARNHPATRTFQALRMAVNDEIGELERFLDAILGRLKPGGRVAVISFHSLEDRVVKHKMKAWTQGCICPKHCWSRRSRCALRNGRSCSIRVRAAPSCAWRKSWTPMRRRPRRLPARRPRACATKPSAPPGWPGTGVRDGSGHEPDVVERLAAGLHHFAAPEPAHGACAGVAQH